MKLTNCATVISRWPYAATDRSASTQTDRRLFIALFCASRRCLTSVVCYLVSLRVWAVCSVLRSCEAPPLVQDFSPLQPIGDCVELEMI